MSRSESITEGVDIKGGRSRPYQNILIRSVGWKSVCTALLERRQNQHETVVTLIQEECVQDIDTKGGPSDLPGPL